MTSTTLQKPAGRRFLEWLRELDEALHPDPVGALQQRLDRLEAKLEAIETIGSADPVVAELQTVPE